MVRREIATCVNISGVNGTLSLPTIRCARWLSLLSFGLAVETGLSRNSPRDRATPYCQLGVIAF